jgi:hypothetical protein
MDKREQGEFSKFLVQISNRLSTTKTNIVKWRGRYFKIKDLG